MFSNGVVLLGAAAAGLLAAFGGITSALIPLYAVGVFTGFTLSRSGWSATTPRSANPAGIGAG